MKKILAYITLIFLSNTNVLADANNDKIIEAYLYELNYKAEKIENLNIALSNLEGREHEPEAIQKWKKITCERREAMRSYVYSINKMLTSKELKEDQNKESYIQQLTAQKNNYLVTMAEEDEMLQTSTAGKESLGFERLTLDFLCSN